MDYPERLKPVRRMAGFFLVGLLTVTVSPPAAVAAVGDEGVAAAAQTGPTLEATIGLEGFVPTGRPVAVEATISTPVLLSGRLRVRGGGISVSRPVEVPAGGEQVYTLTVPSLADGTRLTVEVLDTDGEPVVSEAVSARSTFDELTVGIIGNDELADTLARVRTIITDRPVAPLVVPLDASPSTFNVLGYLILGGAGADRLDDALDWALTGGGVILDPALASTVDLSRPPLPTGVDGVTAAPFGSGRVIVVEGLAERPGDDWAAILRPTALDLANSPEWDMANMGGGLFQAASESGSRQVPSLPWLLFAILGFALLVGPVNFFVLSRLGKRDLAWVTIPAIALVAVVGFWVAGRQRIAGTNVSHATVVISDGAVEARSAVIVAAGVSGERRVSFDPESSVYPERNVFGGVASAELRIDGDASAQLELDQLAFTGVGLYDPAPDLTLPTVSLEDGQLVVANDTELDFWGWGAMRGGSSVVAGSELSASDDGQVVSPAGINQFGFGFIDALINERQLWDDPNLSNGLWALNQVLATETDDAGIYFVGLTDGYQPDVSVDGASSDVPGTTLVLIRAGTSSASGNASSVGATVVGTGFINWLDWGAQHIVATDELTVRFSLPDPASNVTFRDAQQFGVPASSYLAWDWTAGEFAEIERNDDLPPAMVSADGEVYVRLVGEEFGENPFSPDSLSLEWEA